jgi:Protein of unknown function (DUF1592)/Protein of unknown function (DUF1588)/Protein of unknown function (DUF1587)/Protein of unknown function (DUF1595)/Protein of unknown function (DUF1585)
VVAARGSALLLGGAFGLAACSSTEAPSPAAVAGSSSAGGSSGAGAGAGPGAGSSGAGQSGAPTAELKSKSIHRLSNVEYDNTLRDLTGTELRFGQDFVTEEAEGFDNIASALSMSPRQVEGYFSAARQVSDDVFAKPELRGRIVKCQPEAGVECAKEVIRDFGARAFRRPLTPEESASLLAKYEEAVALGVDALGALRHVVHVVLASPQFLYRVEGDPDLTSTAPHPLGGYELASRLSYALWSSMPDDALFQKAAANQLSSPEALKAEVTRMLEDDRSQSLATNFAARWFGSKRLSEHVASSTLFPSYSPALATAMQREMELYFSEFLYQDRPYAEFLTADLNFVDSTLASFYGVPAPAQPGMQRVVNTADQRVGLLGLAGFLTHTSRETRSSPIIRGVWILDAVLCTPLVVPPGLVVTPLEEPKEGDAPTTVRAQMEAHRTSVACSGCHNLIDPIGLSLENFDAIGRYRSLYENGLEIDTAGTMPDGQTVDGLPSLAKALSSSSKFLPCAATKLGTYALGAHLSDTDRDQIVARWTAGTPTLRNLILEIVTHEAFTSRRAEGQ